MTPTDNDIRYARYYRFHSNNVSIQVETPLVTSGETVDYVEGLFALIVTQLRATCDDSGTCIEPIHPAIQTSVSAIMREAGIPPRKETP